MLLTACLAALAAAVLALARAEVLVRRRAREVAELRRACLDLERESAEQARRFEVVSQEMESFSASVSHDLRAPIRVTQGFAQILLEDYGNRIDEIGRGHLRRISTAAERMNAMIDALLAMSRRTSGDLEAVDIDLSRIARELAQELQAAEPGRAIDFDIAPGLVARADPALARLILQNLLANAVKFTSRLARARVEFAAETREGTQAFMVRDNGAGFDMRFAARLFEPFHRLHPQDEYPGTGVGLATVARAVRRHGGRIWADSVPGEGATFHFTLQPAPVRRRAATRAAADRREGVSAESS